MELRKLTTVGKISVIKTIILPKLNNLVLTLPNRDSYFTKTKEVHQFSQESKIQKVKIILEFKNLDMVIQND